MLLPDLHPMERHVFTLVLDLNETLVYSDWTVSVILKIMLSYCVLVIFCFYHTRCFMLLFWRFLYGFLFGHINFLLCEMFS